MICMSGGWQRPAVVELKMDAEIGSYQEEPPPDPQPWVGRTGERRAPALRAEAGR